MNRARARRVLATVATTALLTLPAATAMAAPPEHANAGGNGNGQARAASEEDPSASTTTEDEDDTDTVEDSAHPSGRDRTDHQDKRQGNSSSDPDGDGRGPDRNDHGVDKPGEDGGVQDGDQDGNNGCGNDQDFEDDNEGWCLGGREKPADHPGYREGTEPTPMNETTTLDGSETTENTESTQDTESTENTEASTSGGGNVAIAGTSEGGFEEGGGQETEVAGVQVVADEVADTNTPTEGTVEVAGLQVVGDSTPASTVEVLGIALERPVTATVASDSEVLGAPTTAGSLPVTGGSVLALGLAGLASVGTGAALRRRGAR